MDPATEPGHVLHGFGLSVHGLPGIWPAAEDALVRARLTWRVSGAPLRRADRVWWREEGASFAIGWADYAEYVVRTGPDPVVRVTVGPVGESEAALGFVMSVLPLALPLFGLEPLHGSALRMGAGALLLLGASGAGKSTTAQALQRLGWGFLADDACALDEEGSLWPGPPLYATALSDEALATRYVYDGKEVRVSDDHSSRPVPTLGVVVLEEATEGPLTLTEPAPPAALARLLEHVRAPWAMADRRREAQLAVVSKLAAGRTAVVSFAHGSHRPNDVAQLIDGWVAGG